MPAATVILLPRADAASELARSVLSVSRQLRRDWELRIVHEGDAETEAAARALADPRILPARDVADALAGSSAPVVAFLESGARYPVEYLLAVLSAFQDPDLRWTWAERVVEHGHRFARSASSFEPTLSQAAVRREYAVADLDAVLAMPHGLPLRGLAVRTRFGEPVRDATLTVVLELSWRTPPLTVRDAVREMAEAFEVVVAVAGAPRGSAALIRRILGPHPLVFGGTAEQARAAALRQVTTPLVSFVPAGWDIAPADLRRLVRRMGQGVAAVGPVVLDPGGTILAAGLLWTDRGSSPQGLLAGHPPTDVRGAVLRVAGLHPAGLTTCTEEASASGWLVRPSDGRDLLVHGDVTITPPRRTVPAAYRFNPPRLSAPPDAVEVSRAALRQLGWRAVGVSERPVLVRTEPVLRRRWALKIGAPAGRLGDPWGDVFFAEDLAAALRKLGNDVVIDRDGSAGRAGAYLDRVVLNLRGYQVVPRQRGAVNLLWVISHPADVPVAEMREYDLVYVASHTYRPTGVPTRPLLQATNPDRFHPDAARPDTGPELLFVGNSRHQFRKIIADCRSAGLQPTVIGRDWEQFLPAEEIAARSIPNEQLPALYRSAGIVLNDHWEDMVRYGFLNNRLFDAVACGARVVSDDVPGLREVFGDAVAVYRDAQDLARLCRDPGAFGDDARRRERAAEIARRHSFEARAQQLMRDAATIPVLCEP